MLGAEVGDVVALDPDRDLVHAERLRELGERLGPLAAAALTAQLVLGQRQLRVALGELAQPPLVAALGGADLDGGAAALGQRLGEQRRSGSASSGPTTTSGGTVGDAS